MTTLPAAACGDDPSQLAVSGKGDVGERHVVHLVVAVHDAPPPVQRPPCPSGLALANLFPDALSRRGAEHIRIHATDPTADLPDDDHELD